MSCELEKELLLILMDLQANLTPCCVCLQSSLDGVWYKSMGGGVVGGGSCQLKSVSWSKSSLPYLVYS